MPELIAVGAGSQRQCRFALPEGEEAIVGRAPRSGWAVPWDRLISREHAKLRMAEGRLHVTALETARNPIFLDAEPQTEFSIGAGEHFRIGETSFTLRGEQETDIGDSVVAEHIFGDEVLSSERFSNPSSCLHALCKMPELIGQSRTDAELAEHVVELLLDSIRGTLAAAVMQFDGPPGGAVQDPKLMRWNSRGEQVTRFQPSRRLIRSAMERQQSVVHLWMDDAVADENFTMNNDLDWAFCTPIPIGENDRWCFYASGKRRFSGMREVRSPGDLIAELRTAELIARFFGSVRRVRALEQQHVEMRRFFSPAVIETLAGDTAGDVLAPRSGPVSVLFCDVRGFSRKVEAADDLHALLRQVSQALSVMTRSILKYEGVIADFQGDAALGFWGWPSDHEDAALMACRAALLIHDTFHTAETDPRSPLHGFRVGIGIGHGQAIAGRIGSLEQIKVGVFGPVVNLASRLQDLTKQIGAPILLDGATAEAAQSSLREEEGLLRKVGRFRPAGVESAVEVFALENPCHSLGLPRNRRADYQAAVDALCRGDWAEAERRFTELPDSDPPTAFLKKVLQEAGVAPPPNWDGVLSIERAGAVRFKTGKTTQINRPVE